MIAIRSIAVLLLFLPLSWSSPSTEEALSLRRRRRLVSPGIGANGENVAPPIQHDYDSDDHGNRKNNTDSVSASNDGNGPPEDGSSMAPPPNSEQEDCEDDTRGNRCGKLGLDDIVPGTEQQNKEDLPGEAVWWRPPRPPAPTQQNQQQQQEPLAGGVVDESARPTRGKPVTVSVTREDNDDYEKEEDEEQQPQPEEEPPSFNALGKYEYDPFENNVILEGAQPEETIADETNGDPVVHLKIHLEIPNQDLVHPLARPSAPTLNMGHIEQWVCYLEALLQTKLASTESRNHVMVLMVPYENGYDPSTQTVSLQAVSSNRPGNLLDDLKQAVSAKDIQDWLNNDLPPTHPLVNASVVNWETSLKEATLTSDPLASFSSSDCGVARVGLSFGFFDDFSTESILYSETTNQDINNMICSTNEYMELLYTALEGRGSDGIQVKLDRVHWDLDLSAEKPLTVHFDMEAAEPETGRRIAPVALLDWLAAADIADYIQEAVWTALPYEGNIFFNTERVFLDGYVRYLNKQAPAQTISTENCIDRVYRSPEQQESDDQRKDPSIQQYTSWTIQYGFREGYVAQEPTHEEKRGLFCATYFYFKDILKPESGPFRPVIYSYLSMDAYEISFTPSKEMPLKVYLDVQAFLPTGTSADPSVLRGKLEQKFDIDAYIKEYVWNAEPEDNNIMHRTTKIAIDSDVRERHNFLRMDMNSSVCYRETEAPTMAPVEEEDEEPSRNVGFGTHGDVPNLGAGPVTVVNPNQDEGEEPSSEDATRGIGFGMPGDIPNLGSGYPSPWRNMLKVDASFTAVAFPPGVAPKDYSANDNNRRLETVDGLSDAFAAMFDEMKSNETVPEIESEFDKDSMKIQETGVDCSPYIHQFGYDDDMVCTNVAVEFYVMTTADNDNELDDLQAEYAEMVKTGVENGQLQKSLDQNAPGLGWRVAPVVSDEGQTHSPIQVLPAEAIQEKPSEYNMAPPLWAMILFMAFLFFIGVVSGMNVMVYLKRRAEGKSYL